MTIMKTDKEQLTPKDILDIIADYEMREVPIFNRLWQYYIGQNVAILSKEKKDANNPDNKIIVPYGRKIVTTYTGYGYRPRYITYKANVERDFSLEVDDVEDETEMAMIPMTEEERFMEELQKTFNMNNEHIKTSRAGRNTAIFGVAYEVMYIDGILDDARRIKAEPKWFTADPREIILLYDYSSEPKKQIGIRYYKVTDNKYKVEVYYKDRIELYERTRNDVDMSKWQLTFINTYVNFYEDIPIVAYYFGDEMLGVIKPVLSLIDANDTLYSDSMNEFDRFAYAYMLMKKFGLTDPTKNKDPAVVSKALKNLKSTRIIEHMPMDADVKFLTKDIPTGFIDFMCNKIREQIHIQSHVPDFTNDKMAGASGIAIQRLLFDFENMVSSMEADFDLGLLERIRLITIIYAKTGRPIATSDDITITHKRNMPLNVQEFAQTALIMKQAGFSSFVICDFMPDDIIPDVQAELMRQKKEQEELMANNLEANNPIDEETANKEVAPEDMMDAQGDENVE